LININQQVADAFARIRAQRPLIHHITNLVVMNDTANLTLHLGALPVMAHAVCEVAEMTAAASALLLNLGTLTPERAEAMLVAGRAANAHPHSRAGRIPIVLDPVGVGATWLRTETGLRLLRELDIAVVRGNAGEIASLIRGRDADSEPAQIAHDASPQLAPIAPDNSPVLVKGVESVGDAGDPLALAQAAACQWQSIVAITGPRDVVSDGHRTLGVDNGHRWLTTITGTGCMATTAIAAFAAVEPDPLIAAAGGLACLGLAAERAARHAHGPASFKVALLDAVYGLAPEDLLAGARIVQLEGRKIGSVGG
jgi:hydroxyethylthiazole kinase